MALNTVVGGDIKFSFTDNPDWRSNVTSILGLDTTGSTFSLVDQAINKNTPGSFSAFSHLYKYKTAGVCTINISATRYADKVFTVTVH